MGCPIFLFYFWGYMSKCDHKLNNGRSALEFDKEVLLTEHPKKYKVHCVLCDQCFTIKKLSPELALKLEKLYENIGV